MPGILQVGWSNVSSYRSEVDGFFPRPEPFGRDALGNIMAPPNNSKSRLVNDCQIQAGECLVG